MGGGRRGREGRSRRHKTWWHPKVIYLCEPPKKRTVLIHWPKYQCYVTEEFVNFPLHTSSSPLINLLLHCYFNNYLTKTNNSCRYLLEFITSTSHCVFPPILFSNLSAFVLPFQNLRKTILNRMSRYSKG